MNKKTSCFLKKFEKISKRIYLAKKGIHYDFC